MVAWFVIAIGTVALFAYIAIAGVTAVDTTGTNVSRAETIRRIDAVVASLSERAASPRADGVVMIPAGVASTNAYLLPADLQQVGRTSFGALFQYCPMGITLQNQNDTVNSPAGGAYGIQTVSLNGSAYVASGRAPILPAGDQNIFGFVIAPVSPGATVAGCNQITASGDGYVAPNSIVRAIRRSTTTNEDLTRGADAGTWYVTQEGGGNGSSPSSPSTLAAALEAYRVSTGGRFIVRFGPGTYTVAGSPLDQTVVAIPAKRSGSSLSFVSSSGSVLNLGRIYVPGDFEIRGMDARSNEIISAEGHAVGVRNASVGPITLTGGSRLNIADNSAVFPNDANPATIQVLSGSTAQITNNLDLYYSTGKAVVLTDAGSNLNITSSYVNVRPASQQAGSTKSDSAFIIKTGSKFTVKSSTIDLNMSNEWAIMLGGSMMSSDSFINYNAYTWVGLQTQPGASANFAAVTFAGAQPARYTFATQSASNIVGSGNLYSTQRCWYRGQSSIHRLSPVGVAGDNSSVTPDEPARPMNGLPTAQQAADYQASQARNAERAELRSRTTVGAGFECKQAAPVTWVNCANNPGGIANENAYCTLPADVGNVLVRYGINGTYNYRWSSNGILCDNVTFNPDPVPGVVKGCSYAQ